MEDLDLQTIFVRAGDEFGYRRVDARFVENSDLKIKWIRSGNMVNFLITDYLRDAPRDVLETLAETVFRRMYENADCPYDDCFIEYLTTDNFVMEQQPVYLSRLGCASASPVGRSKDLRKSLQRLKDNGLIKPVPLTYMGWMPMSGSDGIAVSSALMRSVCINERLDRSDVPDDLIDFCLYTQLLKIGQGFSKNHKENNQEYIRMIEEYPDSERFIGELGSRGLSLWKTLSPAC